MGVGGNCASYSLSQSGELLIRRNVKLTDKRVLKDSDGYFYLYLHKKKHKKYRHNLYESSCLFCGVQYLSQNKYTKFCGRGCFGSHQLSKEKQHGLDTSSAKDMTGRDYVRELVRERDGHMCRSCGKKKKPDGRRLDVHHLNGLCGKKPKGYDKISDIPGLITLCHKCHFSHHEFSKKSQFKNRRLNPQVLTTN